MATKIIHLSLSKNTELKLRIDHISHCLEEKREKKKKKEEEKEYRCNTVNHWKKIKRKEARLRSYSLYTAKTARQNNKATRFLW